MLNPATLLLNVLVRRPAPCVCRFLAGYSLVLAGLFTGLFPTISCSEESCERIGPYLIGEVLHYSFSWGPVGVGNGTFETSLVTGDDGESLIRLRFTSKGKGLANVLYPVDDCIDAFIHPATLLPVRVEKKTSEGRFICDSTLTFDYKQKKVIWEDRQDQQTVACDLEPGTTDFYSLIYRLRSLDVQDGTNTVQVVVDGVPHQLVIRAGGLKDLKLRGLGKVSCRNIIIDNVTEGLFVRKIPCDVWVTQEDPRVLARMKVDVPVGSVKINFHHREVLSSPDQ